MVPTHSQRDSRSDESLWSRRAGLNKHNSLGWVRRHELDRRLLDGASAEGLAEPFQDDFRINLVGTFLGPGPQIVGFKKEAPTKLRCC